jgi:predicted HTH transcriptional regulator
VTIDLFVDDLSMVPNKELYEAIVGFASSQPTEGWRHDYTEQWGDSALEKVTAFANTFGGLLFVGVKKNSRDAVCEYPGVDSTTEYKTRIANSIGTNISPVPAYDIHECSLPENPARKFCLVRVRENNALHLITKKGIQPVYVRNEDEARPANADQLRRLIDRERDLPNLSDRLKDRGVHLLGSLKINRNYSNSIHDDVWNLSGHQS